MCIRDRPTAEPAPTESAPTPEPTQAPVVGPDSDANTISQMQEYLRDALGYLTDGAYTPGTYDDATLNAVVAFQMRVNLSLIHILPVPR